MGGGGGQQRVLCWEFSWYTELLCQSDNGDTAVTLLSGGPPLHGASGAPEPVPAPGYPPCRGLQRAVCKVGEGSRHAAGSARGQQGGSAQARTAARLPLIVSGHRSQETAFLCIW